MSAEPLANVVGMTAKESSRSEPERELYRLIETSLDLVGGVRVAAGIMRCDRGDLRRALDDSGRYIAIEHMRRFGERLVQYSPETAQRIAVGIVGAWDLVITPRIQLTAAEQARRYKQLLDTMSPACGVDLARKALETP